MTDVPARASVSLHQPRRLRWPRFLDLRGSLCLGYLICIGVIGVLAPLIAPYSPIVQDANNILPPPDATHLLGTDDLGRDVLSRMMYGPPISLYSSLFAVFVALLVGLPFGLIAGYVGGVADAVIGRVIDTLLSFPGLVLAIAVTGALGVGLTNSMLAVGIVFSPSVARLVRAQTLVVKHNLYVEAARCFGIGNGRIIIRHILPNALPALVVQVTVLLANALLAESTLSFLGLGVQPPQPSWGAMLARAAGYMEVAPEQMYVPGLAILLTALAFTGLGESLRLALDPTTRPRT
jgi:peptide/nickel transport system permease protein